jgi:hypothetical protein
MTDDTLETAGFTFAHKGKHARLFANDGWSMEWRDDVTDGVILTAFRYADDIAGFPMATGVDPEHVPDYARGFLRAHGGRLAPEATPAPRKEVLIHLNVKVSAESAEQAEQIALGSLPAWLREHVVLHECIGDETVASTTGGLSS